MHVETPTVGADRQIIQSYHDGGFVVSGVRHEGSLLVLPDRVLPWPVRSIEELTPESLEPLRAAALDILVIGTGAGFSLVGAELRATVRAWGPVIEAMATNAACRTYNILLAEERRVAAAVIALPTSRP